MGGGWGPCANGDTPGDSGTESKLGEPRERGAGGGTAGLRGAFTTGSSGRSSSSPGGCKPDSLARALASSCACARLSAVCRAITRCLSAVRRHFSQLQYRYLQYRLWPFSSTLSRWLRQRAQLGAARGTPELDAPGSERSSQSSGVRRRHAPTDTMAGLSRSPIFAVELPQSVTHARRDARSQYYCSRCCPRLPPPPLAPPHLTPHTYCICCCASLQL